MKSLTLMATYFLGRGGMHELLISWERIISADVEVDIESR